MTTSDASARPPRWIRTLPWLAGLMLGTTAHIVWWTGQLDRGERRVEVMFPILDARFDGAVRDADLRTAHAREDALQAAFEDALMRYLRSAS